MQCLLEYDKGKTIEEILSYADREFENFNRDYEQIDRRQPIITMPKGYEPMDGEIKGETNQRIPFTDKPFNNEQKIEEL